MSAVPAHVHAGGHGGAFLELVVLGLAIMAVGAYLTAVVLTRRRGRSWPLRRALAWVGGIALAVTAVAGPLAAAAHDGFVAHMWTHLLAGMIAPVLLVLAAPVTLALRTLPVTPARRLSRVLRSAPARVFAHPVTAASLSAGGLWVLYLSPVLAVMRADPLAHLLVHAHLVVAGYLFTAAVIGRDPRPHPPGRPVAAVALILAVASHAVLAKHLYAYPPAAVPVAEAQAGAQFMYYAGAWVEAVLIVVFCADWYRAAGRRMARSTQAVSTSSAK
jgi:putative membrane protein